MSAIVDAVTLLPVEGESDAFRPAQPHPAHGFSSLAYGGSVLAALLAAAWKTGPSLSVSIVCMLLVATSG